jgi:hypothetical protein
MKILVCPDDLIKRCIWDHYVYYVLGSDKEGEKVLNNNIEFEISERDALVIGLLKVIETENLIHKFNTYIIDLLTNKSINTTQISEKAKVLIRKKTLEIAIEKFLDKFPDYWIPDSVYKKSLIDLLEYINEFKIKIEKLEIFKISDQFGTYDFIVSNNVKKLLSFNY